MKLKVVTKTINEVDAFDFDDFVCSIYGEGCETVAIIEESNNTILNFTVPSIWTEAINEKKKEKIRRGEYPQWCVTELWECLYEDGHIEAGQYSLKFEW